MKFKEIDELSLKIDQTDSIKEAALELEKIFTLSKIVFYPASIKKENDQQQNRYRKIDDGFNGTRMLLHYAKVVLRKYTSLLKRFDRNEEITFNEKKAQLLFCRVLFDKAKNRHNYSNMFSFISHDIFFLGQKKDGEKQVEFEHLKLGEVEMSIIKEFFDLRKALYEELLNITNYALGQMELIEFQNAKFKLESVTGIRLLWEFLFAIEQDDRYIKLEHAQIPVFEKALFNFFGLPYKDRGKVFGNYFRKGSGKSIELTKLRDRFQSIGKTHLMKLPKSTLKK